MTTEAVLRRAGMEALIERLGSVDAERFITSVIREPFDYTEWQRDLFSGLSVRELSAEAMKDYDAS